MDVGKKRGFTRRGTPNQKNNIFLKYSRWYFLDQKQYSVFSKPLLKPFKSLLVKVISKAKKKQINKTKLVKNNRVCVWTLCYVQLTKPPIPATNSISNFPRGAE